MVDPKQDSDSESSEYVLTSKAMLGTWLDIETFLPVSMNYFYIARYELVYTGVYGVLIYQQTSDQR
jgi:hypothetical protein